MARPVYPIPDRIVVDTPQPKYVEILKGCLDRIWDGTYPNEGYMETYICFCVEDYVKEFWGRTLQAYSLWSGLREEIEKRLICKSSNYGSKKFGSYSLYVGFLLGIDEGSLDDQCLQEGRRRFMLQLIEEFSYEKPVS